MVHPPALQRAAGRWALAERESERRKGSRSGMAFVTFRERAAGRRLRPRLPPPARPQTGSDIPPLRLIAAVSSSVDSARGSSAADSVSSQRSDRQSRVCSSLRTLTASTASLLLRQGPDQRWLERETQRDRETDIHCPDQPACPRVDDADERKLRFGELVIGQEFLAIWRGGAALPEEEMGLDVLSERLRAPDISVQEVRGELEVVLQIDQNPSLGSVR
jgi:hypothetical protein